MPKFANIRRYGWLVPYGVLAVLTTVLLLALKMPIARLDVPYQFIGDAIDKLAQIHNVAETGWLFHNDRLGYPFGYDRLDFPRFDSLNYALIGPLAALIGPAAAMNLYYLGGFYLVAFAGFYSFRRLGLEMGPALLCALLYAFLPYHVIRNVAHLTNGAYYLVPLAMLVLVWLAQERIDVDTADARRRWLFALVVAALVPLQTPYNGVFFAYLCVIAGAIAMARNARWRTLLATLSLLIATACAFVTEQIPVMLHALEAGKPALVAERLPVEAQIYSMQLNQVLLPTNVDRRRTVAKAAAEFDEAMAVPFSEVRNQYIGAFGVLGFVMLMWALCRAIGAHDSPGATFVDPETAVRIAAVLAIALLLLAISTGLCTLISYWITAKIRAYNRVLPFFAFPCLLGAGWALQAATRRIGKRWLRNAAISLVAVFALYDILLRPPFAMWAGHVADYDRARAYFAGVEKTLGEGAAVFQLPAVWYPEHPQINNMGDYEEFKPFLLTKTLRFSYGVGRGRSGYNWNKYVEGLPVKDVVAHTHAMGFSAILVDGTAYADDTLKSLTGALTAVLPEPPSVSPDRRWWLFALKACCGPPVPQIERANAPRVFAAAVGGDPLRFTAGGDGVLYNAGGWEDPESWGTWASGMPAQLRMRIDPVPAGPLALTLDTRMLVGPKIQQRTLAIDANGRRVGDAIYTLTSAAQELRVELPSGLVGADGLLELRFVTTPQASPQSAGVSVDGRSLGVGLVALSIASADRRQ